MTSQTSQTSQIKYLQLLFDRKIISMFQRHIASQLLRHIVTTLDLIADGEDNEKIIYISLIRFRLYCQITDKEILVTEIPSSHDGISFTSRFNGSEFPAALLHIRKKLNMYK